MNVDTTYEAWTHFAVRSAAPRSGRTKRNGKKKRIRSLKKGEGPLMDEVRAVVGEVRAALPEQAEGKLLLPVVLVYRQKAKKQRSRFGSFPFPGFGGR